MSSAIRRFAGILPLTLLFIVTYAQPGNELPAKKEPLPGLPANKPYQILSSGRQLTLKSKKNIQHVMLWTSGGHRVVEQRDINATSCTFIVPANEKLFFLMVGFSGGKVYTEKIGVR